MTQTQQNILGATNQPGFNFNNQPLGNSGSTQALANPSQVGAQGLSSFGVGRTNSTLGYGGLVLSASSEAVSVLIRALQQTQRMEVLSRPQVMTLDNQPAFVQVGQRVPRITGSTLTQVGQQNNIVLENVGLILGVTPRISPDGRVVMEVDAEKSQLGNIADGIPVTTSGGVVINSPTIELATAQTTVSAIDGETIVIGGLITKSTSDHQPPRALLERCPPVGHALSLRLPRQGTQRNADHPHAAHRPRSGRRGTRPADGGKPDELVPVRRQPSPRSGGLQRQARAASRAGDLSGCEPPRHTPAAGAGAWRAATFAGAAAGDGAAGRRNRRPPRRRPQPRPSEPRCKGFRPPIPRN